MFYVGVDIQRWQVSDAAELTIRLKEVPPFEVCFEASTGYGRFYELLTTVAAQVSVAYPGLLWLIYRSN